MEKARIIEVASQALVPYELTENPTANTMTLAFGHITRGPFYDPTTGESRPIAFARWAVRELFRYNGNKAIKDLVGFRGVDPITKQANDLITFVFGVEGGTLPTGWLPKKMRSGKPVELVALESVLPGLGGADPIEVKYFNSSINEGLVVDPNGTYVPFGLQFTFDDERGLEAKILKASPASGKKSWISRPLSSVEDAVALVERAMLV